MATTPDTVSFQECHGLQSAFIAAPFLVLPVQAAAPVVRGAL